MFRTSPSTHFQKRYWKWRMALLILKVSTLSICSCRWFRRLLDEFDTFVAHNAPFDRSCLEHSAKLYHLHLPEINWQCSLKTARQVYDFGCNTLGYLCEQLGIPEGTHHRAGDDAEMCARLFLKENKDTESTIVTKI